MKFLFTLLGLFFGTQVFAQSNQALYFHGEGGHAQIPALPSLLSASAFTVEFWLWGDVPVDGSILMDRLVFQWAKPEDGSRPHGLVLNASSGNGKAIIGGYAFFQAGAGRTISRDFKANCWNHIALTYDKATIPLLLVNGKQLFLGDHDYEFDADAPFFPKASIYLGGTDLPGYVPMGGQGLSFRGRIDDLRIWNHAKSPSEVKALVASQAWDSDRGLLAWYKMDGKPGQIRLKDEVQGHHGLLIEMDAHTCWGPGR